MKWDLAPRLRVDVVAFAGLNLSGERTVIEIHPVGGRQGDVSTDYLKSVAIVGPIGTRVTFMTSDDPESWTRHPWRAVRLIWPSLGMKNSTAISSPSIDQRGHDRAAYSSPSRIL